MIPATRTRPTFGTFLQTALPALLVAGVFAPSQASAREFTVASPDKQIVATVTHHEGTGMLSYRVRSRNQEIIAPSPIGIETDRGDFRSGLALAGSSSAVVNETYRLPQGKVSTYHNHANELTLRLRKGNQELHVHFRAYDDGVAFGFSIPGSGEIRIASESSGINLSGGNLAFWGQDHPNNFGYESRLGPINGERMSIPVFAWLGDRKHFVLMAQAATYGHYIQPHFTRSGGNFRFSFPLDQEGLVQTTLPFQSPWRMVIISPDTPAKIIDSQLVENLNPPTDRRLLNSDGSVKSWVKPGRVMWDFIAGDRERPRVWIDAAAEMGWEYYMADAGFAGRFGGMDGVKAATAYAATKNVGVIGWAHSREFDTHAKAAATIRRFAEMGLKGAKIDFFDHNTLSTPPNRNTRDYEDTQISLQIRDWIFDLAIENQFLLELHGNTMPTGERRRYPNLMTLEGVNGMEKREPVTSNDLTVPFTRNVMGPVSYTVLRFSKSPGTHAYQLAMPVVYEAGLMIYAELHQTLLDWAGRELIKEVPANWDETRFIDGLPASHVIIARRKGEDWFVGGMTGAPRKANVRLSFLPSDREYNALIFRDGTRTEMAREVRKVNSATTLSFDMLQSGGFALRLSPAAPEATRPQTPQRRFRY